jgi:protease IV
VKRCTIQLLILITAAILLQSCAIVVFPGLRSRKSNFEEIEVKEARGWFTINKVLLVDISGILTSEGHSGLLGSKINNVDELKEILKKAEKDPSIKALVLRINSPGGGITASDIMYHELMEFKKSTGKIIIAEMMGVAASGGYYISMATDKVLAHPTTVTGSIGVISIFPKIEDLANKIGVNMRVIKSGSKKDIGSLWRDFDPEEREILQSLIDEYYEKFLDIIALNRTNLERDKIRELADGRIFTAKQALDSGLIDGIAYLDDAINMAMQDAGVKDASVVMYKRSMDYRENIYSMGDFTGKASNDTQIGLINLNLEGLSPYSGPRFMYLWLP